MGDGDVDQRMPVFPWPPWLYRLAITVKVGVVEDESRYRLKEVGVSFHWDVD